MSLKATIAIILMLLYLALMRFSFVAAIHKRGRKIFIAGLYILGFLYIAGQGIFYATDLPDSSPDEVAHISYIYYVDTTNELIPHFEDMHLFNTAPINGLGEGIDDYYIYNYGMINYLCHPSLYYQIMRAAGGFNDIEQYVVEVDKMRLRYFSFGISLLGVAMLLYIGWSRINKSKPWLHLIYITSATCIPIMCLEMCAVTNDSLALLTTSLCALGLIRFCEEKRNFATYLMISGGITFSFLNKMTAAMLCVVMSLIVLVVTIIKEKSFAKSLKKEFWFTTPLFILPIIYIIVIYQRYGVLQPTLKVIAPQGYFEHSFFFVPEEDRPPATLLGYILVYFNNFFLSWAGLVTQDLALRKTSPFAISTLPMELLWIAPAFAFTKKFKKAAGALTLPIIAGWFSILITFLLQLKKAYGNFINNGYTGGSQARYYVPLIFCLALAVVFVFESLIKDNGFDPQTETTTVSSIKDFGIRTILNQSTYLVGLIYSLLLFYGNLPFFLLHN
ncbi:hypothetical protein SAMN02910298_02721 [Pseudobutyrivibrio sp. YE44]|uniref:hypothetical protein n=1 Tax=Pseudobutyrivibrio sp. YE44 TaxID=1520802 RepID=UPI0008912A89|nr:hypothetical protein [Pseudobutyrivibrio sp. YE44]SDB53361.1 hypothetical protein SAMN02910298_02721 [Pseudobutyrivibrio sp. YE44]